jgi:hypothetical protein
MTGRPFDRATCTAGHKYVKYLRCTTRLDEFTKESMLLMDQFRVGHQIHRQTPDRGFYYSAGTTVRE